MYLREMGSVELLSREGEIAIAKRIEAGREAMIAGPVREPADLPGHHHLARRAQRRQDSAARHHRSRGHLRGPRGQGAAAARCGAEAARRSRSPRPAASTPPEGEMDDEDDFENALSLAAMEAELKPKVLETFDNIAGTYKKLRKQQDKKLEQQVAGESRLAPAAEGLRQAARRDHRRRQEPVAQQRPHREPGRAALRSTSGSSASRAG